MRILGISTAALAILSLSSTIVFASPTATESELNATTVHRSDMVASGSLPVAPRIGLSPSAPDSLRNATTAQAHRSAAEREAVSPAPRIGISPSAASYAQDASTVHPLG